MDEEELKESSNTFKNLVPKDTLGRYSKISSAGVINKQFENDYTPEEIGLTKVGNPEDLTIKLEEVGYQCLPFVASQISLALNTQTDSVRSLLLEGPSGCGKSFLAKCLAKITGAELMCLTCLRGDEFTASNRIPFNACTGKCYDWKIRRQFRRAA